MFEALRRLGLSALELHAAVNGESAADGTVLRDGDEMILIPSIQGGRAGGVVMKRMAAMVSALVGLGLVGSAPEPVAAQTRVVVPIVIQVPRAAPLRASMPSSSVTVTTRTQPSPPGTTTTRITVRDTSGAGRDLSVSPRARTDAIASSGTSSVLVTVDRSLGPAGPGTPGRTRVTVEDVSRAGRALGGPVPTSSQRMAGLGQQTWTIASDEPIAAPIVILGH